MRESQSVAQLNRFQIGILRRTMLNHAIVIMVVHVISLAFRLMAFVGTYYYSILEKETMAIILI